MIGPGFFNTDATVARSFYIGERYRLQFRCEVFNVFNHPKLPFDRPADQCARYFGKVLSQFDPRQIQLAVKLGF